MFQSPIIKQKCNAIIFIISNINLCAMHWSSLCWVITSWLSGSLRSLLYSPSVYSCHKEGWVVKNWCFWTVVLEKTLESSLDCKEIQSVHPKGNHPWIFIGRTDAEAEAPILWPPDVKSWLIGKDSGAGKDWRQEKGTTGLGASERGQEGKGHSLQVGDSMAHRIHR